MRLNLGKVALRFRLGTDVEARVAQAGDDVLRGDESVVADEAKEHLPGIAPKPVAAPKGSKLECVAHYDNSDKNKYNPDPTKLVTWGPQTWDEMMIGYLDYVIDKQDLRTSKESASR